MTSHSYVTDDVKFQGFLEKQGRLTGPLMVKKYWCVLDEHRLSYYKNSNKSESCCGFIDVSRVQSVLKTSKVNSFNILTHSGTHTFVASSAELRDQWVKALQDSMSVAGRRLDMQRQSIVSCVMYESDDEMSEVASSPTLGSVFEVADKPTLDNNSDTTNDHRSAELEDDVNSAATFTYMNAADVAEALQSGHTDSHVTMMMCPGHQDREQESEPDRFDEQLSAAEPLEDCTSDVRPGTSETAAEENRQQADSVDRGPSNDEEALDGETRTSAASVTECPRVTMRRPSRATISHEEPIMTPPAAIIELHIDTDLNPTSLEHFQLDQLSAESGSAVDKLRQFLDTDSSAQCCPTAIQPGKAFDSLKYFLSTLQ